MVARTPDGEAADPFNIGLEYLQYDVHRLAISKEVRGGFVFSPCLRVLTHIRRDNTTNRSASTYPRFGEKRRCCSICGPSSSTRPDWYKGGWEEGLAYVCIFDSTFIYA